MPKETFLNLPSSKKESIDHILLDVFSEQPMSQVKVSQIVVLMQMSRGAFYKYFKDLEDAYSYVITKYAIKIHQDILDYINENRNDFFFGIEEYLRWCGSLSKTEDYWKSVQLLTKADPQYTFKRINIDYDSPMMLEWHNLLDLNNLNITTDEEAVSFLYFIMQVVMNAMSDFVVNDWSLEDLMTDYQYRIRWLKQGLQ